MADTVRNGLLLFVVFVAVSSDARAENVVCPNKTNVACTLQILYENKMVSCDQVPDMSLLNAPTIKWPTWSSTQSNRYTLFMLDPDLPGSCGTNRAFLHWWVELIINSSDSAVIVKTIQGAEYYPPTPPPNQLHRYQFQLYPIEQSVNFALPPGQREFDLAASKAMLNLPGNFTASFQYKYSLPKPRPILPTPAPTTTTSAPTTTTPAPKSNCAAQCGQLLWNFLFIVFFKYSICLLL